MNIILNGKPYVIENSNNLLNILKTLDINPQNLIAEVNGEIVTAKEFENKIINENDVIELVKFIGGG